VDAQAGKARSLAGSIRQMETLDPAFAKAYQKANRYETLSGNKHFRNSDFQVQRSPRYYFSVKMCSERVIGAESCNSENIRGYYLGDGATYLYQSGKEYENIFPYWDWKKIPGTTTSQDDKELPILTASGYRIKSSFVGGVSDGQNGIAAMDYNRNGITAKKAWFNFSNSIVCLGAGIKSAEAYPVATTVNQCFLSGEVTVKDQSDKILPTESSVSLNPIWILHDQTGYFFPDKGNLKLETKTVTGSWNQVALMYKPESMQSAIFKLWFDHGLNPDNQKYAYILVPDATKTMLQKMETSPSFRILRNDTLQQAVISPDQSLTGVVFRQAGKSDLFGGLEVSAPCIVMLKKEKGLLKVSLSDPTQKLSELRLTMSGKYALTDQQATVHPVNGKLTWTVTLPAQDDAGNTVTFKLKTL
jgi:chondroitin AC lyase